MKIYKFFGGKFSEIELPSQIQIEPTYKKIYWINDKFEQKQKESWQSQGKRKKKPVR